VRNITLVRPFVCMRTPASLHFFTWLAWYGAHRGDAQAAAWPDGQRAQSACLARTSEQRPPQMGAGAGPGRRGAWQRAPGPRRRSLRPGGTWRAAQGCTAPHRDVLHDHRGVGHGVQPRDAAPSAARQGRARQAQPAFGEPRLADCCHEARHLRPLEATSAAAAGG
jgi:hypothetical protein